MIARTIYRDTERGKLAGVVAGLADHFGWNLTYTRWGWIIATLFWPPVMIAAYILMAWLLDPKPRIGLGALGSASLSSAPLEPTPLRNRFSDVRDRFARMEQRLRSMEKVVTSREFQMDRELRNSGPT